MTTTPREYLLGTWTAYVPPLEDASSSFFSNYHPQNDTFGGEKNNVQIGVRPSWVLQARELTELQSILMNQFRLLAEGDEVKTTTPFHNYFSYGGIRGGWFNPNTFVCTYEVTRDFLNYAPQSAIDKYNSVYGPIQLRREDDWVDFPGVGDYLNTSSAGDGPITSERIAYPNFKDFKRITFGPGHFYVTPQNGQLSYLAQLPEQQTLDLFGWWPSRRGYAEDRHDCCGGEWGERYFVDPDGDGNYPPNEQNANGSGDGQFAVGHFETNTGVGNKHELLGQYPDVTYFIGLNVVETLVKPGVSSKSDRLLLDNATGYNNHEAPGAYRIKYSVESVEYIPVFTGELCPYGLGLFNSLVDFPWDGEWGYKWQVIKDLLNSDEEDDVEQGQIDAMDFLYSLGYELKDTDQDVVDNDKKRVVLYKYPSAKDYFNIFNKHGFRRTFVDTENHLDDREKNRISLNPNSVVWDYRLIDPEYLKLYLPENPSIGNGLMETYLSSEYYVRYFGFALGTNSSISFLEDFDWTEPGDPIFHWFSKKDPMYIPYVSTSKYGLIGDLFGGSESGSFTDELITTVAHIKSLASNALKTEQGTNFLPILHTTYNQWEKLQTQVSDGEWASDARTVFDTREMRFIISPAPMWDYVPENEQDDPDGIHFEHHVYSSYYNELLPVHAYNDAMYFAYEPSSEGYSWEWVDV